MRKKKWRQAAGRVGRIVLLAAVLVTGSAETARASEEESASIRTEYFDRYEYHASEKIPMAADLVSGTDVTVNISKRAEWTDQENGNARITLAYASDSGTVSVTPDMNVILIQDKSGSMDANYGYNLEKARKAWGTPTAAIYYPIQNTNQWSIRVSELKDQFSTAKEYLNNINRPNAYTASYPGYDQGEDGEEQYYHYEVKNNSPCQLDDHYYLLVETDEFSGKPAWTMVNGKNLYNIMHTDLHHYQKLASRDTALKYLGQGCRVLCLTQGDVYYNEEGMAVTVGDTNLYFLDRSELHQYGGKWILCTCTGECQVNDRLSKSQEFMDHMTAKILSLNPGNKIAYLPFWSDVPDQGTWTNWKGNAEGTGVIRETRTDQITQRSGVTKLDLTSDESTLRAQIDHPFTYNGTNWANAFANAVSILKGRNPADKEKETLVLFLTDGMPGGSEGQDSDRTNPALTGMRFDSSGKLQGGSVYELQKIPGVTIWSIGVGINESDTTGLTDRLGQTAERMFFARTTQDFETLREKVLQEIDHTYVQEISAEGAFFTDQLSKYFELDTSDLDKTWKVLETEDQTLLEGVPKNVYEAVKDTGITHVYVKSTKTVYWYIGRMSTGSYDAPGHAFSFPVRFLEYSKHTDGKDKALNTGTAQYVTYYSTKQPSKQWKIEIDSPQLVFHRKDSQITIHKKFAGTGTGDRICHYVYSKKKYTSGKIKEVLGSFDITIPAGALSGTAVVSGLENGKYYFYETDQRNVMISPEVREAAVDYAPKISSRAYGSGIPRAVTTSDGSAAENRNNYLSMSFQGTVSFEKATKLTVIKEIESDPEILWWEHGNPTFMIRVQGLGSDGKEYTFFHTFEFTKDYVNQNEKDGKVSMSHTFYDIPVSESYLIEEIRVGRYTLETVTVDAQTEENRSVLRRSGEDPECYGICAKLDLNSEPSGISVTFCNKKVNDGLFSDMVSIKNIIEENVK